MKKLSNIGIFALSFTILAVILISVDYSVYAQTNSTNIASTNPNQTSSLNTTLINSDQNTQQAQQTDLQPFTVPREIGGNSGDLSNSQFSPPDDSEDSSDNSIVLLNQNYDNERFGDRVVGELLNNGSETAEFVQVSASFYDEDGAFLGTASGITQPSSIPPGGRAGFEILITSDTIEDDTERYEFSIQWNDDDFDQHTIRITGEQSDSNESNNDNNNNDNNNNDNNNNDNNNNDNNNNDNNNNDNSLDEFIDETEDNIREAQEDRDNR